MIDEDQFRKESKKLAAFLADPEVEVSILKYIFLFYCRLMLICNVTSCYLLHELPNTMQWACMAAWRQTLL